MDKLDGYGAQSWLEFRPRMHEFQDFCSEQLQGIKGREKDAVLIVLQKSIKKYLDSVPVFKCMSRETALRRLRFDQRRVAPRKLMYAA